VTDPGYFGDAEVDPSRLGQTVADDPRFSLCAAKRFYAYFNQVELRDVPADIASALQSVLVDSGMDAKELAKAVVLGDAFRVSHARDEQGADELVGMRKVRPRQLARMVEALTGYRWHTRLPIDIGGAGVVGEVDLMNDAFFGFKVLAGGIDSNSVTRPSHTTSATVTLVVEQLAARAADHAVYTDFERPLAERRLFTEVELDEEDPERIRDQVVALSERLYGVVPERGDDNVDEAVRLFFAARDLGDGERAFTLLLYAMLQDIRFTHY
jgi:hypothetical protein